MSVLSTLDTIGHALHLPHWLMGAVCDEYDRRLTSPPTRLTPPRKSYDALMRDLEGAD